MEEKNNIDESIGLLDSEISEEKAGKKKSAKMEIFSWIMVFVVAFAIAYVVNNFVIINANVPSGSMEKTIMTKDRMIGLRTAYWFSEPQRGDIIIFKYPDNEEETYVKRLIGMPGDKVVIQDAKIYINDSEEPLKEDYLPEEWTYLNGSDEPLEYQVPEECYFMLGDNRNHSKDAREWENTYVKKSQIVAKAEFVYWPWNHKGLLETADYAE